MCLRTRRRPRRPRPPAPREPDRQRFRRRHREGRVVSSARGPVNCPYRVLSRKPKLVRGDVHLQAHRIREPGQVERRQLHRREELRGQIQDLIQHRVDRLVQRLASEVERTPVPVEIDVQVRALHVERDNHLLARAHFLQGDDGLHIARALQLDGRADDAHRPLHLDTRLEVELAAQLVTGDVHDWICQGRLRDDLAREAGAASLVLRREGAVRSEDRQRRGEHVLADDGTHAPGPRHGSHVRGRHRRTQRRGLPVAEHPAVRVDLPGLHRRGEHLRQETDPRSPASARAGASSPATSPAPVPPRARAPGWPPDPPAPRWWQTALSTFTISRCGPASTMWPGCPPAPGTSRGPRGGDPQRDGLHGAQHVGLAGLVCGGSGASFSFGEAGMEYELFTWESGSFPSWLKYFA